MLKQMPKCLISEAGFNIVFNTGASKQVSFHIQMTFLVLSYIWHNHFKCTVFLMVTCCRNGLITWHFLNHAGEIQVTETDGYYVPELQLRLLSPQAYFHENQGGHMQVEGHV